jgi:hypothetical protein
VTKEDVRGDNPVGDTTMDERTAIMAGMPPPFLPAWDETWELEDPLRGRTGWTLRDYANIGASVCLVTIAVGLLISSVTKLRDVEVRARNINKSREIELQHR